MFKRGNEAYQVLSDKHKREQYDIQSSPAVDPRLAAAVARTEAARKSAAEEAQRAHDAEQQALGESRGRTQRSS